MPAETFIIKKDTVGFLKDLAKNNNREWFGNHKNRYLEAHANIIAFADALLTEMNKHDKMETASGKDSVFRIYKDVRFAKDKTPYNTHWSGSFKRATSKLRGGYYYRIEPGNSLIVGGFWGPDANDMKRIRQDIDLNYPDWQKMLSNKAMNDTFGSMTGDQLTSAPRGYAKDHPAIDLLRYKQFKLWRPFTDAEVLSPGFVQQVSGLFQQMRPFFDFMSDVLTTDINGVPVVD